MIKITSYRSLHINIPIDDYDTIENIVKRGKYVNISDAARRYLKDGIRNDLKEMSEG